MFKRVYIPIVSVLLALGLLAACGGGGGGGGGDNGSGNIPTGTYQGSQDPAQITAANAQEIVQAAYLGATVGAIPLDPRPGDRPESYSGAPSVLTLYATFKTLLEDIAPQAGVAYDTVSQTLNGPCGGYATVVSSGSQSTGIFLGTIDFNSYCWGGLLLTGRTSFTGAVNVNTGELVRFILDFGGLTFQYGGSAFTVTGGMAAEFSGATATIGLDTVMTDHASGIQFWSDSYQITVTSYLNYVSLSISGRFYHSDYGYVTSTTPTAFQIHYADNGPITGVLEAAGSNGTRARLTCLTPDTYEVTADTTGDGNWDYASGVLNW